MKKDIKKPDSTNREDKKKRFKTVASRRVQKVIDSLDNLSKCANRRNYEYSEDEVKKMFKVLNEKMSLLKAAYSSNSSRKKDFEF